MTHAEALRALLTLETDAGVPGDAEARRRAEVHAASCADCWEALALLSEVQTGSRPAEDVRMRELLGCDGVRQRFYLVSVLEADELAREHPDIACHVGWCESCRAHLLAFLSVERGAREGEFALAAEETSTAPAKPDPPWRRLAGSVRHGVEATFELVEAIGMRLGRAAGDLGWLVPESTAIMGGQAFATRGDAAASPTVRVAIDLLENPIDVDLTLRLTGDACADVVVETSAAADVTVRLRATTPAEPLVASQTASLRKAAVFRDVPADDYVLELEAEQRVFRIRLAATPER